MRHAPGDRIGPYLVRSTVDESESTAVLEVEHSVLRTTHALKILAENDGDAFARSLHHGARLQAMIDHPHVVRCTDAGEHAGLPWLVMDWMNGGSLAEMLDARGALHPALALRWLRGITRGLRALHQANVVHRDLKPSNVMFSFLGTERRPRISDLGLAKWLDHTTDHDRPSTLSMEFRTIGTPEYMAPEQSADPAVVDVRADLYSLGVLLYEMLTNEVPYEAEDGWRVTVAARLGRHRPLRELRPELPEALGELVAALLQPDPGRRPKGCEDVLVALDALAPSR
jgi:serine/threonine protein kinase